MSYPVDIPVDEPLSPTDPYGQLTASLDSPNRFRKAVKLDRPLNAAAVVAGVTTVLVIALTASQWGTAWSTPVSRWDATSWVAVGFPLLVIVVFAVLLVISLTTIKSAYAEAYARFSQGGFIADLISIGPIPGSLPTGRITGNPVFIFGRPDVPPEQVCAAAQQIKAAMAQSSDDETEDEAEDYDDEILSETVHPIRRPASEFAVSANLVDPSIPDGIFIYTAATWILAGPRVAIPDPKDHTCLLLSDLRKNVLR